jgi:hypothetical protein
MDPEAIIRGELSPSETLLWSGRPRQGIVFRAYDLLVIPFSLLWLAFCVLGLYNTITESPQPAAVAMGAVVLSIFILGGLYVAFGRFFVERWQRKRTVYGITSERVIMVSHSFQTKVKSISLDTLVDLTLTESANGAGTITFGPLAPMAGWYAQAGWSSFGWQYVPLFELAENTRQVYEIVRDARRAATKRVS